MAIILNIDTALDEAMLTIASDGDVLFTASNPSQKDHAGWIHPAIQNLLKNANKELRDFDAVAVNIGPGSYTGLRVGLATAKGLCYAVKLPLIAVGSLEILAWPAMNENFDLVCPMIDARRMEVFTAAFDKNFSFFIKPQAMVLDENSFAGVLKGHKILFLGNGAIKFQKLCRSANAIFQNPPLNSHSLAALSYKNFIGNNFADVAYTEPLYLKEFYSAKVQFP
jgi:tRNA threonylcarbamoyladenosine biosynthesis protein TsaB